MVDALDNIEVDEPVMFGKYRLVRTLSAAGAVHTYQATIDGLGGFTRPCIIKRLAPSALSKPELVESFVTQARRAGTINHPHIAQAFDFGRVESEYYVAMDYTDGMSLQAIIRAAKLAHRALGPQLAVHVGIPLCDALSYVERAKLPSGEPLGLVHQHLLPGYVLVSYDSVEVKLTNFGDLETVTTGLTPEQLTAITNYRAPELGEGAGANPLSTVFAIGAIIYEVATGRVARDDVLKDGLASLAQVLPDVPVELAKTLQRALSIKPQDRQASTKDLWAELNAVQKSQKWRHGRKQLKAFLLEVVPDWSIRADSSFALTPTPTDAPSGPHRLPAGEPIEVADDDVIDLVDEMHPQSPLRKWVTIGLVSVGLLLSPYLAYRTFFLHSGKKDSEQVSALKMEAREHRALGLTSMDNGEYAKAIEEFKKAALLDPTNDCSELVKVAQDLQRATAGK